MLHLYAHPASQPSRSVIWACVLEELPFRLIPPNPTDDASINRRGQIPVLDDEGFVLSEMPAILTYLASRHGWLDLYPEDMRVRARIAEYLHTHHSLTRLATTSLMAPHVLVAFGGLPAENPLSYVNNLCIRTAIAADEGLADGQKLVAEVINFIERAYLGEHDFLAGTARASIADLACYEEIAQLEPANLFDVSANKNLRAWLRRMRELPHHDDVHRYNTALGDIQSTPNSMARFSAAVTEAFSALSMLPQVHIAA